METPCDALFSLLLSPTALHVVASARTSWDEKRTIKDRPWGRIVTMSRIVTHGNPCTPSNPNLLTSSVIGVT